MTKTQIDRAMEGLVEETIIPAFFEDCGIIKRKQFEFARQCIIDKLNKITYEAYSGTKL